MASGASHHIQMARIHEACDFDDFRVPFPPRVFHRVAPPAPLKESYVHCPGVHAFTSDTLGTALDRAAVDHCSQEAIVCVHQNIRKTWAEVGQEVRTIYMFICIDPYC